MVDIYSTFAKVAELKYAEGCILGKVKKAQFSVMGVDSSEVDESGFTRSETDHGEDSEANDVPKSNAGATA
ncbi:hypothetical protein ACFX13_019283 [Malus domestica]